MRTKVWMIRELDLSDPDDRRIMMAQMDEHIPTQSSGTSQTNLVDEDSVELATPGQVKYLRRLKYDGDPRLLTKFEASKKIKELTGEGN